MEEPIWITLAPAQGIHAEMIREHGGSYGVRDEGLIESAVARAQQRWTYGGDEVDLAALAAAYASGVARNHSFVDGNKRIALAAMGVFLRTNGVRLITPQPEAYAVMIDLATGELSEEDLARWLRGSTKPLG